MHQLNLEDLPKETLAKLAKMYSRNWLTLDRLWFQSVETEYGLEAAVRLDLNNWESQSVIEAQRIKEVLGLGAESLSNVLTALSFMTWHLTTPMFECEEESPNRIVFHYPRCPVQEGRQRQGKPAFPCKAMKSTLISNVAGVIVPGTVVSCLQCPPDPPSSTYWCRWELRREQRSQ